MSFNFPGYQLMSPIAKMPGTLVSNDAVSTDLLDRFDHFLEMEFRLERLDLRHQGIDQALRRAIGHAGDVVDRFFRNVALASSRLAATPPSRPYDSARAALPRPPGTPPWSRRERRRERQ
jgi:hypothetical protein